MHRHIHSGSLLYLTKQKLRIFLIVYHLKQEDDLIIMHTVKTCSVYAFSWKCRTVKGDHLKFQQILYVSHIHSLSVIKDTSYLVKFFLYLLTKSV